MGLVGVSFLVMALVLTGCHPMPPQRESREDTVFRLVNRVKSIADGDSIILETPVVIHGNEVIEVRLLGIDAPETFAIDDFDYHNQARHGQRATQFLEYLLSAGTEITLTVDQRKLCSSGRLLATVEKGDLDINKQMLRQGYVAKFVVWPNSYYEDRFTALQSAMLEAKRAERGIWSPSDPLEEIPLEFRGISEILTPRNMFRSRTCNKSILKTECISSGMRLW